FGGWCRETHGGANSVLSVSAVGFPGATRRPSLARQPIIPFPPKRSFEAALPELVPGIHVFALQTRVGLKSWMAGTSPAEGFLVIKSHPASASCELGVEREMSSSSAVMSAGISAKSGVLR